MKAQTLYSILNKDFDVEGLHDDWSFMDFNKYVSPQFKERNIGLVLDNSEQINKVYSATMPDTDVLEKLIQTNETDILLFSHHAMGYDPAISGIPFYDIPKSYLEKLKQRRISFYVLHVPLDLNGEYSTAVTLAKYLKLEVEKEFCEWEGRKAGVICKTEIKNATEFADYIQSILGHQIKLYKNGDDNIRNGRVAIAAGGGSVGFVARELVQLGINMYLTGCTREVPEVEFIAEFHKIVKEEKINVIGATHYTTEKFACIEMVKYFIKLGLDAEFIEGKYFMKDL